MMCGPRNEAETVKRSTESDMTEGTEETTTDPEEVLAKRSRRGAPRKPRSEKETTSSKHSIESSVANQN